MLNRKQFDILDCLYEEAEIKSQKALAQHLGISTGIVNKTYRELTSLEYVDKFQITKKGFEALEPYRVTRAVFLAAGMGERMIPVTLNTPKPLVRVHGKRIIDRLIDAVLDAGIEELYIVRGYLGELFDQLLIKYPMIKFIENPLYNQGNNILSVAAAGEAVINAYVMESDLLLINPKLIKKYQYSSNVLGIPMEYSNDWCLYSKKGIITGVGIGGENCHQTVGITYWNKDDGARVAKHYKQVIELPGGKERFAGYAPFVKYVDEYKVRVRECTLEDVVEIDTFQELQAIDPVYQVK